MHPLKAPGPNDMSALFSSKTWSLVHNDVCSSLLKVLNEGANPSILNPTLICLILKKNSASNPKDFRSINLCNVICKLLSEVIVNMLKLALLSIIYVSQSTFILGRLNSDNALERSLAA
ncbi:hypothetical protein C2S51_008765 [Perilla frutescens var. frutescens]|nr:hypothetical protein C2S51_008765 [Perilla frutescens var. frutescens]